MTASAVSASARILIALVLIGTAACPACAAETDGILPDPVLTPGEIRSTDRETICAQSTRAVRNVSVTTKVAVRRAYGITPSDPKWCAGGDGCEIDHRIPLVVGGGNTPGSIRNLWAQRGDGPWSYHRKDICEAAVGRDLCAGKISVEAAQAIFLGDWRAGCAPYLEEH